MGCGTYDKIEDSAKDFAAPVVDTVFPGLGTIYDQGSGAYDDLTGHTAREQMKRDAEKVAADALTEETRIAADKARINTLFGIGPASTEPFDIRRPRPLMEWEQNRDTRQGTMDDIYGNVLGEYTNELDNQFKVKGADVKAMLSGRGLSRSSVGQSILDNLGYLYDTNEAKFEQGAGDTVSGIKAADEQTRIELINMIDAGGDYENAAGNAISRQKTNLDAGVSEAKARDLTNLFRDMDRLYGQKQYVDEYNTGQQYGSTNITTPGSSGVTSGSSGTVLNY